MYTVGGDWRYFWPENIADFTRLPYAWDASLNTGIGQSSIGTLWINSYLHFTSSFSMLGMSWSAISLVFWILPAFFLSFISSVYLFRLIFPLHRRIGLIAGIVYSLNTYFLMIFTGGQLGVALSYSLIPFVLARFIKVFHFPTSKNGLITGLLLAMQLMFDPRLVYLTLIIVGIYLLVNITNLVPNFRKIITFAAVLPFTAVLLLHSYWLLPLITTSSNPLPKGFDSLEGLIFFSFANLENSISLLHPNWPDNIFGKTNFMRPEFLVLPILAYTSLLFIKNPKSDPSALLRANVRYSKQISNSKSKIQSNLTRSINSGQAMKQFNPFDKLRPGNETMILYFTLLGLIGAFLGKGVNEPLGGVYIWLYQHLPGFQMFRDPTKWYTFVALSYAVLIPYSIVMIYERIKSVPKFSILNFKFPNKTPILNFQNIFLLVVVVYLFILVRPVVLSKSGGLLRYTEVPEEYIRFKRFLTIQPDFFRTYWIPQWQRFGYFSDNHPAIGRHEISKRNETKGMVTELKQPEMKDFLYNLSVKYIIVPYDSEGELFIKDRKYDDKMYRETIEGLNNIKGLSLVKGFGSIAVFKTSGNLDRFTLIGKKNKQDLGYHMVNPTKYEVAVKNVKAGDKLVFSEGFDENWKLRILSERKYTISSKKYKTLLNSFVLPKDGNYTLEVMYEPQRWVDIGVRISLAALLLMVCGLVYLNLPELKEFRRRYL